MNSNMCGANFAFASLREAKIGELCPIYHLLTHAHISAPLSTHRAHTGLITRADPQTQTPLSRRSPGTIPISAVHISTAFVRSILLEPTPEPTLQAYPRLPCHSAALVRQPRVPEVGSTSDLRLPPREGVLRCAGVPPQPLFELAAGWRQLPPDSVPGALAGSLQQLRSRCEPCS